MINYQKLELILFTSVLFILISISISIASSCECNCTKTTDYPFELNLQNDILLSGVGGILFVVGQYRLSKMEEYDSESKPNLPWDKKFRGTYDKAILEKNVYLHSMAFVPLGLAYYHHFDHWTENELLIDVLMFTEVVAITSGLNLLVRSLSIWPRPLVYNESAGEAKVKGEVAGSFYSGDAANGFAIATFLTYTTSKKYDNKKITSLVAGTAYTIATGISYLRVAGGKHYPTDVFVGAILGGVTGWLIPWLHQKKSLQIAVSTNSIMFQKSF